MIKKSSAITESEKDTGDGKYDKMKRLDEFRERVKMMKIPLIFHRSKQFKICGITDI